MFEKIRKMKNKKGFTLVELIVVLVILAILVALLIPALTGYIDKANKQKIIATTRQVMMAAQTETSEAYAKVDGGKFTTLTLSADTTPSLNKILELAEVATVSKDGKTVTYKNGISKVEVTITADGHVDTVTVEQSGFTCVYHETVAAGTTYTDGNYDVQPTKA
ncbi:type II secretion system protein [uncultured Gemmiger sp.]|uniref:type II secretion system protein n=1 Tax=uncultured Gemmiger sp. TaxID=1623490 RepID=UPI00265DF889|nr:type II secretion system protein [uncultured Gemmiger sp.]